MKTLLISAGHSNTKGGDRGASALNYVEGDLTIEFRDLICKELDALNVKYTKDRNQDALSATLSYFKALFGAKTLAIDCHFNAYNGIAEGTEVIIPDNSTAFERNLANNILTNLVYVGFKNRGVKAESKTARKRLGWMRPNAEQVLIEVCFIYNKQDMNIYQIKKLVLAKDIARSIQNAMKQ